MLVDAKHLEGVLGDLASDTAIGTDLGEVAGAAQKAIGDAWCATATSGDFFGATLIQLNVQDFGRAIQNDDEVLGLVEIEAVNDAEAGAQRRGNEAGARGGANQREMAEGKRVNARAGTLANDEVDAKILHGGIENFFDGGLQAMNFIEEEKLFGFEGSGNRGEVAFAFEKRTGTGLNGHIQFVGDDLRKGGLAQARGPIEQHMIESLSAIASRFERDGDVFLDALLADVFVEALGANAGVDARVIVPRGAGNDA